MSKIIFTSHYMRDAPPAQLENYVKYIGTRDGVEKIDESKLLLPATVKQQQLITQLIRDIPSTKEMLEYADYCESPTIGNSTEFISLTWNRISTSLASVKTMCIISPTALV